MSYNNVRKIQYVKKLLLDQAQYPFPLSLYLYEAGNIFSLLRKLVTFQKRDRLIAFLSLASFFSLLFRSSFITNMNLKRTDGILDK